MASETGAALAVEPNVGGRRYTLPGSCSNCGWSGTLSIPKGTKAPGRRTSFIPDGEECPRCGCRTVTAGHDTRPRPRCSA